MVRRIAFLVFIALFGYSLGAFSKAITVDAFDIAPGETKVFAVNFTNSQTVHVSFQADLELPVGLTLNTEDCYLSSRFSDKSQKLYVGEIEDGVYRIITTSFTLTPIKGNSGALIYLSVTADANYKGGSVTLTNMMSVDTSCKSYDLGEEIFTVSVKKTEELPGDVNQDGVVNKSDLMLVINQVVGIPTPYADRTDINGDGVVNISDITLLTSMILDN